MNPFSTCKYRPRQQWERKKLEKEKHNNDNDALDVLSSCIDLGCLSQQHKSHLGRSVQPSVLCCKFGSFRYVYCQLELVLQTGTYGLVRVLLKDCDASEKLKIKLFFSFRTKNNDEFGGCHARLPKLKTAEDFGFIAVSVGYQLKNKPMFWNIAVSVRLSNTVTAVT